MKDIRFHGCQPTKFCKHKYLPRTRGWGNQEENHHLAPSKFKYCNTEVIIYKQKQGAHLFRVYFYHAFHPLHVPSIITILTPGKKNSMSLAHTVCINFLQAFLWLLISCFVEVALFLSQQAIHFKTTVVQQIKKNILKLNQFYLHLFLSELNACDTFPLIKRKYLMPPSMQSTPSKVFLF